MFEKTVNSKRIYEGKVIKVRVDTVELPDKKYSKREIVEHPGAVAILPITNDGHVILVKQFRKPVESFLLEIPAGKIDSNESPEQCAIRELKEETGIIANKIEHLTEFYTSAGFSNEKMHLFIAKDLIFDKASPDVDEFLEIIKVDYNILLEMIRNGEINDCKTIIAVLTYETFLKNKS